MCPALGSFELQLGFLARQREQELLNPSGGMVWLSGVVAAAAAVALREVGSDAIDNVYIVYSNHLDVGYTLNNNGSCAGEPVCAQPLRPGLG